jgi:hypothetical protein
MSARVVDRLETIEVKHAQRERASGAGRPDEIAGQVLVEGPAVAQPGQGIDEGGVSQSINLGPIEPECPATKAPRGQGEETQQHKRERKRDGDRSRRRSRHSTQEIGLTINASSRGAAARRDGALNCPDQRLDDRAIVVDHAG